MRTLTAHLKPEGGGFRGLDTQLLNLQTVRPDLLLNFDWYEDGTITLIYQLTGERTDELERLLDGLEHVYEYDIIRHGQQTIYLIVHHDVMERLESVLRAVNKHGILLETPFQYTDEGLIITASGSWESLQRTFFDVDEELEILSMNEFAPYEKSAIQQLTERQYEALMTAQQIGYYEIPREASLEDVSDSLGCAQSTANQLLRRAENTLISSFLTSD